MSNIIPFSFESHEIRTIADDQGSPWFVLRDVLGAMGTTTPTTVAVESITTGLGDGFNSVIPIADRLGREQQAIIIAESAVTYLLSRSDTEQGRRLNRFIHVEVLPAIRRTGAYTLQPLDPRNIQRRAHRSTDPVITQARQADALMTTYLKISKLLGTDPPTARAIAVENVRAEIGMDFRPFLIDNTIPEAPLTPTDLGKELGISARKLNAALEQDGFQERDDHDEWRPTDQGKPYCTVNPYKSPNSDHVGYRILWYRRVLDDLTAAA